MALRVAQNMTAKAKLLAAFQITDTYARMSNLTAAAILVDQQNRILLCQRKATGRRDGSWSLPGTKVGAAETDITAIRHELLSSLGIRVDPSSAGTIEVSADDLTLRGFIFTVWQGRILNLDHTHCSAIRWFDQSNLPDVIPSTNLLIETFFSPIA